MTAKFVTHIKRGAVFFSILLGVQLLLLTAGAIYQSIASAADRQAFPPPGQLVYVGGHSIHIFCRGPHIPKQPTVILEGGLGAPFFVWSLVQPKIADLARVCSYDRAGYAWSDATPQPRTARQMADELHSLLQRSGESAPYLLVGHSLGGIIARVYAAQYPQQVSGLVLVDARHPDFFTRMPAGYQQIDRNNLRDAQTLRLISPFGLTRILAQNPIFGRFESYIAPLPDAVKAQARALMVHNPQHWATAVAERESSAESYTQARESALSVGLPLIVLSAENGVQAWKSPNMEITTEDRQTWMTLQKELSELSSNSRWVIVPNSGHYIHLEQPDVVVDAIRSMLGK